MMWVVILSVGFLVGLLASSFFLDCYYRRELHRLEVLQDEVRTLRLWRAAFETGRVER